MADERPWIRAQAVSGLAFATFLVLHLLNTAVGAYGAEVYDGYQRAMRWYYQFPLVEILAVGVSALVHAVCGFVRIARRRKRGDPAAPLWLKLHRASGVFLAVVLLGHVAATRGPSLLLGVDVDFSYLHFSLVTWPAIMFPYYFILYGCGAYHLTNGASLALRMLGVTGPLGSLSTRPRVRVAVAVLAVLAGAAGILAMAGLAGEVDQSRFPEYRALYEEYLPFMVTW